MAVVPNKFRPGSFRSSADYLRDVPQISDDLVEYFRRDKAPPDELARRGEREIAAACAELRKRLKPEVEPETIEEVEEACE